LVAKGEMCPLEVTRHVLEIILDDQVGIAELYPSAVLVTRIGNLVVTVALLSIETEILR
jgi:hypothetical protein